MKVLPNIIEQHSIGVNCGTNAVRVALRYMGYNYTEEMVFGLGSGLGFIYQYYTDEDSYFVSGKNESLENNICSLLGGQCISGFWDDNEKAWSSLKEYIDHNIPIIVDTSIRELPYFQPYMENLFHIGFGLHNVLVAGYDEDKRTVLLLDHRWTSPQIISMEDFEKARSVKNSTIQPRNGYRVLLPANYCDDSLERDVRNAIILNINRMRYPFAFKMGLKGMKLFERDILKFYEEIETNAKHLEVFGILLEKLGTGGGNYRRIYGNFLKQAGKILEGENYIDIGNQYIKAGNLWKRLANLLLQKQAMDKEEVKTILDELVLRENSLMDQLEESIR